jgi:hypothetical protein
LWNYCGHAFRAPCMTTVRTFFLASLSIYARDIVALGGFVEFERCSA